MPIVKTNQVSTFSKLTRGAPFMTIMTLYTRSEGKEEPKQHLLYKINNHKAATVDKRTHVHFIGSEDVLVCTMEKKDEPKREIA